MNVAQDPAARAPAIVAGSATEPASDCPKFRWHLITCEYPPQLGGVSDYTRLVAEQLAASGDEVHVWCPHADTGTAAAPRLKVHGALGRSKPSDLLRLGKQLNRFTDRHLLVQWVPHGYGFRSMNLPFCFWLWARSAWRGDEIDLMVHEAYLGFHEGSWRQDLVAAVHRLMTIVLLRAARRIWISTPTWESHWRPYLLGRRITFSWLPIPSNVPVVMRPNHAAAIRNQYLAGRRYLLGHFSTHGAPVIRLLKAIILPLMKRVPEANILFIGENSERFRADILAQHPELADQIHAAGMLDAVALSEHLMACDIMLQPYPDGISSRRTSAMAALAHGVPMVTTAGHLTEPLWHDCGAIAITPVGDTSSYVEMVCSLVENPSKREQISARARRFYADTFDLSRVTAALRNARKAN